MGLTVDVGRSKRQFNWVWEVGGQSANWGCVISYAEKITLRVQVCNLNQNKASVMSTLIF